MVPAPGITECRRLYHNGAAVYCLSVRTHKAGVDCSNPTEGVRMKTSLVRKVTENHFIKSAALDKTHRDLSLVSATLEMEFTKQRLSPTRRERQVRCSPRPTDHRFRNQEPWPLKHSHAK